MQNILEARHTEIVIKSSIYSLVVLCLLALFAYAYFVQASIVNGSQFEKTQKEILSVKTQVAEYESIVLSAQALVTKDAAIEAGYVLIENPVFAKRAQNSLSLLNETAE